MVSLNVAMSDQQSDVGQDFSFSARPVVAAAWRGRFIIPRHKLDINISAHVSNKSCFKVLEVASGMPESLCLEIIPRRDVWPTSFKSSLPTEHSVGLFFFSDGRDDAVLDSLLMYAISNDFALKAMIGHAELLIFTSVVLPEEFQRFQGKHYLWGVFRGQQTAPSHQFDSHVQKTVSSNSSTSRAAKADRRGRRLDAAWEHAKPLDVLRQKAQCRHCGFISSHGGISRLKAHLGGGNPKIHLPGCNMVPPQVKKLMADWFGEWLKSTKALWTKEIRDKASPEIKEVIYERMENSTTCVLPERKILMSDWAKKLTFPSTKRSQDVMQTGTRGRPLDNAWEHGKPLDKARQMTRCNYCGFMSTYGGISRLKAHLGGGSPQMQLKGCPQVSLQVKNAMQKWFEEWSRNSKALWTRKSHGDLYIPSKRGRPVDDNNIWEHAILLDETGEAIKCKYCGFVSKIGGIDRLKAHLAGGDPKMHLEGCPHVSPEVKMSLSDGTKKCRKKAKSITMETVGGVSQGTFVKNGNETQWFEKRHHILQETLDEITNMSLKMSLKKIIDDKNANVQKVQMEILSLENQLASIP